MKQFNPDSKYQINNFYLIGCQLVLIGQDRKIMFADDVDLGEACELVDKPVRVFDRPRRKRKQP